MKSKRSRYARNSILVIDSTAICHYVKHGMVPLDYNGVGTEIIYGFLATVLRLQSSVRAGYVSFCWDSALSKRKDIYPPYKANRNDEDKTDEDIQFDQHCYNQFNAIRRIVLGEIGFKNIHFSEGLEGDDMIASVCQGTHLPKIIVARDQDMWQLLSPDVCQLDYQTGKVLTYRDFRRRWGIRPEKWADVKAIGGCPGDNVAGVVGVGDKTAAKYLRADLKVTSKAYEKIESQEGKKTRKRNDPLVRLPFEGTPAIKIEMDNIWWKDFEFVCLKYGFDSFLSEKMQRRWKVAFKMEG